MKPFRLILILWATGLCFSACNKSSSPAAPKTVIDTVYATVYPDYMKLKPGNYWIYEFCSIDSTSVQVALNTDSFYVEKDTLIGSNTYHKLVKNIAFQVQPQILYLRDSLSYVVSSSGQVVFSSNDFSTIFQSLPYTNPAAGTPDTIQVTYQMGFKDSLVSVPIGVFPSATFRQVFHFSPPLVAKEYDWKYVQNVGLVSQTIGIYSHNPVYYEDRLLRYHVE